MNDESNQNERWYHGLTGYQWLVLAIASAGWVFDVYEAQIFNFSELFPTHLRATGTSFCFNGGRILAVPVLFFSGWLKAQDGMDLRVAISSLGVLFLLGVVLMFFLPETKGQELPE